MQTKLTFSNEPLGARVICWTWKPNLHVVQLYIGNIEVRRWKLARSSDAIEKFHAVKEALINNARVILN